MLYISDFQKLPQSKRVSQSLNGDLYFSNVRREDTRNDYICYARFPHTQTIQQKQPITVRVLNRKSDTVCDAETRALKSTQVFVITYKRVAAFAMCVRLILR